MSSKSDLYPAAHFASGDSSDYCLVDTPRSRRLSQMERLTLLGGADLERAIEMFARQLSKPPPLGKISKIDRDQITLAHSFYGSALWREQPHRFFVRPTQCPNVAETLIHGLRDGEVVDLEFASVYKPAHPAFLSTAARESENATVHARWWRHSSTPRATMVAVHGWTMGDQRINSLAFLPGLFYGLGIDVVLVEMPYHGRRRPQSLGSELVFPGADLIRTNEGLGQMISDLRELRMYLENRGAQDIGSIGMSLGGYCSALWAALDGLAFCIPIVPLVSMADLSWKMLRETRSAPQLAKLGVTRMILRETFTGP